MTSRPRLFSSLIIVLLPAVFIATQFVAGCSRESPRQYYGDSQPEPKPYPGEEVQRVKDEMDKGLALFSRAIDADTQEEKNSLAREALDRHFYPAQEKLDSLREEYPEHVQSIDSLYQELNRRILDATRMIGTGD